MSSTPRLGHGESNGDGTPAHPAQTADELIAEGLLRHLSNRDASATEQRLAAAMAAIDQEKAGPRAATPAAPRFRTPRWALAAAAIVVIAGTAMMLGIPGEQSAMAQVQQTLAAMRSVGDRRYVVQLDGADETNGGMPNGIIDTRSPGLLLIQHRPPWQREFTTVGRDEQGKWAIRSDGQVERANPNRYWPPWVTIDGESLFADSLDELLESLPKAYTLGTPVRESLQGGDRVYSRITATRINTSGPQPHVVDLWIDPETRLADRVEFRWNRGPGGHSHTEGEHGAPREDGDEGRFDHGPDHNHKHHDGPRRPMPDHEHDFDDHHEPHSSPDGRGRAPHDHDHEHDDDFVNMPPLAMMQWMGEEGVMLMWSSKPGGRKGGPPRGEGRGKGGPGLLTFQRIPVPELPTDWFTPASHMPATESPEEPGLGKSAGNGE